MLRKLLLVGLTVALIAGSVVFSAPAALAAPGFQQGNAVHIVGWGETLYSIARIYGVTVERIAVANDLANPTKIYAGQRLIIPSSDLAYSASSDAEEAGGMHVVQPGENLYRIAQRYGVTVRALADLNNVYNVDHVATGVRLVIPGSPTTPAVSYQPQHASDTHSVQKGETLASIAYQHGVALWTLIQANNILNPSRILPGQILTIPNGDSLAPAPEPTPEPAWGGNGKRILIDLSEQHLWAYRDEELVYSFVVSTGMAGARTISGSFRVLDKIPNAYAYTWNLQMPHWLGIYWVGSLENGIHALPILPNGLRLWDGYLGTPVSYGCVILGVDEARLLYNWAEVGVPVVIRY
jgi:LysM repeat protein